MAIRLLLALILPLGFSASALRAAPAELSLWRLDCGTIEIADLGAFSDVGLYEGQRKTLVGSCYLVKHGTQFLLWDTGLNGAMAGKARDERGGQLGETIITQLGRIGVRPEDVTYVGISHYHYDHTGQVADFPRSKLLISKADFSAMTSRPEAIVRFAHWLDGQGQVEQLVGDRDVFGDGRVQILSMPGHTEGHQALLVRLATGPVLLSGDQYHFSANREGSGVPKFNVNRADTLASHDRFEKIAANLRAKVIIQHEPADVAKLPRFPQPAR